MSVVVRTKAGKYEVLETESMMLGMKAPPIDVERLVVTTVWP